MKDKYEIIGDVRGKGPMIALELVKDRNTKAPATEETKKLVASCYGKGNAMKGFFGRLLIIDMTDKTTRVERIEDRVLETVLGGKGLGTQLLLKYNPAGVDPFSPDNLS